MSSEESLEMREDLPDEGMTVEQRRPEPPNTTTTANTTNTTNSNTSTTSSVSTTTTTTTTNTTTNTTAATTTTTNSVSVAVGTEDLHSDDSSVSEGDVQGGPQPPATFRMSPDSEAGAAPPGRSLRTCRVCGDRAKSMHFGGLSCDSCKAFFRRAVHNDAFAGFACPYDGSCVINIASRKCCQYCRYKKCTSIGMERSWVMSEEDRAQMMKQRAEKKAKMSDDAGRRGFKEGKRELLPFEPDQGSMLDHMTAEERDEIERAVVSYRRAYNDVPYRHDLKNCSVDRPSVQIINMFTTVVRRFAYFARLFPDFCDLPPQDQGTLLRGGILEMSLIRGVQTFDTEHNRWPDTNHQLYRDAPTLRVEDMKKLVSCELYEMHMKFIHSLKELNVDEPVMMLLLLIVLFTSDRPELSATSVVQRRQDHYLHLLRRYLGWRYGPHNAPILYPRLLIKLTDLRELNDQHTEYNLKLAKQEIAEIQVQLGRLSLGPYAEWPAFLRQEPTEAEAEAEEAARPQAPEEPPAHPAGVGRLRPGVGGLLALVDLEQLAGDPGFQRLLLQQFQKSVLSVLGSPNFGLGSLLPDGRAQEPPAGPSSPQQDPVPPQQQQQQPLGPPGQAPGPSQGVPQGCPAPELMAHLEYLESGHPAGGLQGIQQAQAFQQLEHQLMGNVGGFSSFGEQSHQHLLLQQQQQYQYHLQQQQQQQHLQHQALLEQHHLQQQHHHMAVVPKEEPTTPSPQALHPSSLPLDDPQCMMALPTHHLHQDSPPGAPRQPEGGGGGGGDRRRNSLTDYSGLTHFRNLLEEFATLNNPDHLQQVKQILGPDLVASLQQKLVEPEAAAPPPPPPPLPLLPQQPQAGAFPSHPHPLCSPATPYQFFPGGECRGSDGAPSTSYLPDAQYGPPEAAPFCRSQHRGTPPAVGVAPASPPPVALYPVPEGPHHVYQYTQDLVHNVTSAT